MATESIRGPARPRNGEAAEPAVFDTVAYWLSIGAIYLLQLALWYYPAKEKIFDQDLIAPQPIKEQFDGTFIDSFPGTSVAWGILGIVQGVIFLALVASLARGEFLPQRRKPILLSALSLALVMFALLLFGNSMTQQFDAVSSQYTYFGMTVVLLVFVLLLPPCRSQRWLSSLLPR